MSLATSDSELIRVMTRQWMKNFMKSFAPAIGRERNTAQVASSAMIDGLAGVAALAIAGRQGSKDEIVEAIITALRKAIDRDLQHLSHNVRPAQTSD